MRQRPVVLKIGSPIGIAVFQPGYSTRGGLQPPAFGGLEGRWTPEDLLLGALASCYTTTFRTLAEYSKFVYTDLQVEVVGVISKAETGYSFVEVSICANLIISQEAEQERAVNLLHKAKGLCLVSRALAISQKFEPKVKVGVPVAQGRP
ncbi:MAG TPA: OsmC family protein [Candidatus Dormibacteraeota bacterium]|nr:OsmC family protein [Candidatus Dormibacteraeota bacterium]